MTLHNIVINTSKGKPCISLTQNIHAKQTGAKLPTIDEQRTLYSPISFHLIERLIYLFFILKTECGLPVRAAAHCAAHHRSHCLPPGEAAVSGSDRQSPSSQRLSAEHHCPASVQPSGGTQPGESRPPRAREPAGGAHLRCPFSRFSPTNPLPHCLICRSLPAESKCEGELPVAAGSSPISLSFHILVCPKYFSPLLCWTAITARC